MKRACGETFAFIYQDLKVALPTDQRTDQRTDGPTDGPTDTPSYRNAKAHLKIIKVWSMTLAMMTVAAKVEVAAAAAAAAAGLLATI